MVNGFQRDISASARARVAPLPRSFEKGERDNDAEARSLVGKQALARLFREAGQRDTAGHLRDMSRPERTPTAGRDGTAAYKAVPLSRCPVPRSRRSAS